VFEDEVVVGLLVCSWLCNGSVDAVSDIFPADGWTPFLGAGGPAAPAPEIRGESINS
jgi:hypothetical protein